jgi:Phage capsid family
MPSVIEAKTAMRDLATKSAETVLNKSLTNVQKKTVLDQVAIELKQHQATLTIHENAQRLMVGGESLGSGFAAAAASGRAMKGLATPSLSLSPEEQSNIFMAAKSGQNLTISLKDATSSEVARGELPAQFIGLVDRPFEPTRLLSHIPSSAMSAPSVEFITHTANTVGIGAPVITLGSATSGGSFAAATYFWKLSAVNGTGETVGSNELTVALTLNQKQPINWTAVVGATGGYRLYRGTVAGQENVLVASIAGQATATYTDLGAAGTNASVSTVDRTAGAATVHPGAQMPETSLTPTQTILVARKLAIFSTVTDELQTDFPTFSQYLEVELQRQIIEAENWQIVSGSGTGDDLLGLLNVTGTLSRAKQTTDAALDVIEQGITDLRNGPSFCEPDAIVIHPSTWSTIRRTKNTLGNYILGDPGQSTVSDVWGVPVLQTTQMLPGTVVLANLQMGAQVFVREGITLSMTNSSDNDFTNGKVKVRATERLALGVSRPTAINVLTGF